MTAQQLSLYGRLGLVIIAGAALGFALARIPSEATALSIDPPSPIAELPPRATERQTLVQKPAKEGELLEIVGFAEIVDHLQARGFSEHFAEWSAFVVLGQRDFQTSFETAAKMSKIPLWASGAAAENPEQAVRLMDTLPQEIRDQALSALLLQIGGSDPELGMKLLARMSGDSASFAAFRLFETWAESSPQAAAIAASDLESPHARKQALSGVFHAWSVSDPEGMLAWAAREGRAIGQTAFRSFYIGDGMRDPEKVLRLIQKYPDLADSVATDEVVRSLVQRGQVGWKALSALPASPKKNHMMMRFGEAMGRTDPAGLFEIAKKLDASDRQYLMMIGASRIAQVAPKEMAQIAAKENLGATYQLRTAIEAWAGADPSSALTWASSSLTGRQRTEALGAALGQWAKADPASVVGAWEALQPGIRAKLLSVVAGSWGKADPTAALNWASSLQPLQRMTAVGAAIQAWSEKDPVSAAHRLGNMAPEGLEQTFQVVARNLAGKNPASGVEWVERLPNTSAREVSVGELVRVWGNADAEAASDYVDRLEKGRYRDRATEGLVNSINKLDPSTAAEWAESIEAEDIRKKAFQSLRQQKR